VAPRERVSRRWRHLEVAREAFLAELATGVPFLSYPPLHAVVVDPLDASFAAAQRLKGRLAGAAYPALSCTTLISSEELRQL
jgi:hypothetical protein